MPIALLRRAAALLALAVLACHAPARAQTPAPATPLPEIAVDPTVDVFGDAFRGLALRKAVILMRHGVRPPTSTPKFQVYANAPFPTWDVPDGYLTGPGAALINRLGNVERVLYTLQGLLPLTACPAANDLFVWADNADERTVATGQALVDGLYPGCGATARSSSSATADPLFSPNFPQNTSALIAAVLAHMGGSFAPVQAKVAPFLARLNTVLGCCSTTVCQTMVGHVPCSFADIPWTLTASGNTVSFGGALATGSSLAQIFELEYENGFSGSNLAFGRLSTPDDIRTLEELYTTKYREFDRTPALARANGSDIALQMLDAIETGTGVAVGGGPPDARLTVFVGHDSTLSAVGGLLGLDWHSPSFDTDDMPAGGGLGFELLQSTRTGAFYVRPIYLTQTLDEMHEGAPLTLARLPVYTGLTLAACEFEHGRLCTLATFTRLLQSGIDPASTAPMTYD